ARVLTTLVYALRAKKLRYGVASLCIGGGMGIAMAVEALNAGMSRREKTEGAARRDRRTRARVAAGRVLWTADRDAAADRQRPAGEEPRERHDAVPDRFSPALL